MARTYDETEIGELEAGELETGELETGELEAEELEAEELEAEELEAELEAELEGEGAVAAAIERRAPELRPGTQAYVLGSFPYNSAAVTAVHLPILDRIAADVVASQRTARPIRALHVSGHTDNTGAPTHNQVLGAQRALATESALVQRIEAHAPGLSQRIQIVRESVGAARPVAPNTTPAGRAKNRRVVVRPPATPRPVTFTILVRNRLVGEPIAGATVTLSTPLGPRTAVTGRTGRASLPLIGVPAGTHRLTVTPGATSAAAVGPATASGPMPPPRIWRVLAGNVVVRGGRIVASRTPRVVVTPALVTALVQPVWMRSANRSPRPPRTAVSAAIVHHTGEARASSVLNTFLPAGGRSAHYVIDRDGQIIKMVQEAEQAVHAGNSHWAGRDHVNQFSVGIEIVHAAGPYPAAQRTALIGLLRRIRAARPGITRRRIVAHSDIGTTDRAPRRLGRKSGDPGLTFDWAELERAGLGLAPLRSPAPTIYGDFFRTVRGGRLRVRDRDATRRYGGVLRSLMSGLIAELQRDLRAIGYFCPATGVFDKPTQQAVAMFQEHFFGGSRGPLPPVGQVDGRTAMMIKAVRP